MVALLVPSVSNNEVCSLLLYQTYRDIHTYVGIYMYIYIYMYMIPVLGSPNPPPPPPPLPPARPSPNMPNPCDCAYFSRMAAPKSTATRISSQTHPILVTMDAFQPGLRHEGIEKATVIRRRSCRARFLWQLTQERNMMMMMMMMMMTMTISKHPAGDPKGVEGLRESRATLHQEGVPTIWGGGAAEPGSYIYIYIYVYTNI